MPNTIADKLNLLDDTKSNIKQAIIDKGVSVSDSDTFASYANKIASIDTGGGDELTVINSSSSNVTADQRVWIHDNIFVGSGADGVTVNENILTISSGTTSGLFGKLEDTSYQGQGNFSDKVELYANVKFDSNGSLSNNPINDIVMYFSNGSANTSKEGIRLSLKYDESNQVNKLYWTYTESGNDYDIATSGVVTTGVKYIVKFTLLHDGSYTAEQLVNDSWNEISSGSISTTLGSLLYRESMVLHSSMYPSYIGLEYDMNDCYVMVDNELLFRASIYYIIRDSYWMDNRSIPAVAEQNMSVGDSGLVVTLLKGNGNFNPPVNAKTITNNGTYNPSIENLYGYNYVNVQVDNGILTEPAIYTPSIVDSSIHEQYQYDTYTAPFVYDNVEYNGVQTIKIRKIGSWIDANISADNIRYGHSILGVAGNVIELVGETKSVKSTSQQQTIYPSSGKNGITEITVQPMTYEAKTGVNASRSATSVYPSQGYDALSSVTINAVDASVDPNIVAGNIKKGINILGVTGNYDNYVAPVTDSILITPSTSSQTILASSSNLDGYDTIDVSPVTASIDANITAGNIKRGTTILGVTGTFVTDNLQNKTVDPKVTIQHINADVEYDGLDTVTINPVTASIDSNIAASNIKKDVTILGVTGNYEPPVPVYQEKTVNPTTSFQEVTADNAYDALSKVKINAVTNSIDANILAENIKKNINILGVTGSYEGETPVYQTKTVNPTTSGDIEVTADSAYDALVKVIVKAVTASIDPNILPNNIRKDISIMGVVGTLQEGEAQQWFDFRNISAYVDINQATWGEGGNEALDISIVDQNGYSLEDYINKQFAGLTNINAVSLTEVYGISNLDTTEDNIELSYIYFDNVYEMLDFGSTNKVEDGRYYLYPFENNDNVNGLLLNSIDNTRENLMYLYILKSDTKIVPALSSNLLSDITLPSGYSSFRYATQITIPAFESFDLMRTNDLEAHWVKSNGNVTNTVNYETGTPVQIGISASDSENSSTDYNEDVYKLEFDKRVSIINNPNISWDGIMSSSVTSYQYIRFRPVESGRSEKDYTLIMKIKIDANTNYNHIIKSTTGTRISFDSNRRLYVGNADNTSYQFTVGAYYWIRVEEFEGPTYAYKTYYILDNGYTLETLPPLSSWNFDKEFHTSHVFCYNYGYLDILPDTGSKLSIDLANSALYRSNGLEVMRFAQLKKYNQVSSHIVNPKIVTNLSDKNLNNYCLATEGTESVEGELRYWNYDPSTKNLSGNDIVKIIRPVLGFNKNWEACFHFKLPGSSSKITSIMNDYNDVFYFNIYPEDNRYHVTMKIAGGSYNIVDGYFNGLRYNSEVYCKVTYNVTNNYFKIVLSTDKFKTKLNTLSYYLDDLNSVNIQNPLIMFSGFNLYLDEFTYLKDDEGYIWNPSGKQSEGLLVNYSDNGDSINGLKIYSAESSYILQNGIIIDDPNKDLSFNKSKVSGFNAGNNAKLAINPGFYFTYVRSFNWELKTKFKLNTSFNSEVCAILGGNSGSYLPKLVVDTDQLLALSAASSSSSYDIANGVKGSTVLSDNTDYFVKLGFNGTEYYVELSTDGTTYAREITVNKTTLIRNITTENLYLGTADGNVLNGSIDLSCTSLALNNKIIWRPYTGNELIYVISNNDSWSMTGLTNLGQVGTINLPAHNVFTWNNDNQVWDENKMMSITVNDANTIIYMESSED